jgi:poly(A) polymerase
MGIPEDAMQKAARRIVEKLRLHGHEAFFAGGWVRDFLLRHRPKDIDIATSATPEEVLQLFPNSTTVGAKFGVIQVHMYGRTYEVTTFRSDNKYLDGRHPSSVTFSGPQQDAHRRDFTVNGLFYDPAADRLIDYVHGKIDIKNKLIRTIGNPEARFSEDKLRMMRAIRFACTLGFEIAPGTWEAIQKLAPSILEVSGERIRDELSKVLTSPAPHTGLDLLLQSGLLGQILPEVEAMRGIPRYPQSGPEADVFSQTRAALAMLRKPSSVLALGTLLHDTGKPSTYSDDPKLCFKDYEKRGGGMAEAICRRLRMSNEETERVVDLVLSHPDLWRIKEMRISALKRFLHKPHFADHLELHRAICLSGKEDLEIFRFCRQKLEEYKDDALAPPLLRGEDLIEAGYKPGSAFGEILKTVEDLQLEGTLRTREEALEYVKRSFPLTDKSQP